jgi:hypothetical protein
MTASTRMRVFCLFASVSICTALPGLARSAPALYTGSVYLRLWQREVPYGALQSAPGLANSPSGSPVSITGNGPAAFTLPAGQLSLMTSLIDPSPPYTTLDSRSTRFTCANETGSFFGGGATVATGLTPLSSIPASEFGVSFSGGPGRFGGVMKLLGSFNWRGELAACSFCEYRTEIPLSPIGGPVGGTAMATTYLGGSIYPATIVTATAWGFPWDTGTVSGVAAVAGTSSATATSAAGTDQRSAAGLGTLQLVTPFLVRVKSHPPDCGGCENRSYYAGIARAELRFVPEPSTAILLTVGSLALASLSHYTKGREP